MQLQKHDSASQQESVAAWQEEEAPVSKYAAELQQLETQGKTIPSDPSKWQCNETGVKENLWLNLSTGFIGSGRPVSMCTLQCTTRSESCHGEALVG